MNNRMMAYWANILNCSVETIAARGVHFVPRDRSEISGLLTFNSTVIALPGDRFEYFQEKLQPLQDKHLITYTDVINLLHGEITRCGYLLYQGYAEKEDFKPHDTTHVRAIKETDMELFMELKKGVHQTEWEHGGMDKEVDSDLFGYFLDGKIAAASNYLLWGHDSASIGVLTHSDYRNRGLCKAVASAAMQQAFDNGLFVLYQTILENRASISMARKLGVKDFGLSFRVFVS